MTGGDGLEGGLEIGERFDAVYLGGLDQRRDAAPGLAALVVTGEQRIFSAQSDRTDQVFDAIGVDLDAAVMEEGLQAIPVAMDIGQLLAERDLAETRSRCSCSQSPNAATSGAVRACRAERRCPGSTPQMSASTL